MSPSEREQVIQENIEDVMFSKEIIDKLLMAKRKARRNKMTYLGGDTKVIPFIPFEPRDRSVPEPAFPSLQAKVETAAASTVAFIYNYNTVESAMLASAILITLYGLMFQSGYLKPGQFMYIGLTNATVATILISILYYFLVVWSEIVSQLFPFLACGNQKVRYTPPAIGPGRADHPICCHRKRRRWMTPRGSSARTLRSRRWRCPSWITRSSDRTTTRSSSSPSRSR
jgi:hypothetical protein